MRRKNLVWKRASRRLEITWLKTRTTWQLGREGSFLLQILLRKTDSTYLVQKRCCLWYSPPWKEMSLWVTEGPEQRRWKLKTRESFPQREQLRNLSTHENYMKKYYLKNSLSQKKGRKGGKLGIKECGHETAQRKWGQLNTAGWEILVSRQQVFLTSDFIFLSVDPMYWILNMRLRIFFLIFSNCN